MSRKLKIFNVKTLLGRQGDVNSQLDPLEYGRSMTGEIFVWAPVKAEAIEYLFSAGLGRFDGREVRVGQGIYLAKIVEAGISGIDGDILVQRSAQNGRHVVRLRRDDNSDPTHVATWRYDRTVNSPIRSQLVLDVLA